MATTNTGRPDGSPIPLHHYSRERIDISSLPRIPEGKTALPGLPDYTDEATYTLLTDLAREIYAGDPQYDGSDEEPGHLQQLVPFAEFEGSPMYLYFAGGSRPTPEDPEFPAFHAAIRAHTCTTLDLAGNRPGIELVVSRNISGKRVGFISYEDAGTLDTPSDNTASKIARLNEALSNIDDPYWTEVFKKLGEQNKLPWWPLESPLEGVRERLVNMRFAAPVVVYGNPIEGGVLIERALRMAILDKSTHAETIREARDLITARQAFPDHHVVLVPLLVYSSLTMTDQLIAYALQLFEADEYRMRYQDQKQSGNPSAEFLALFEDPNSLEVINGIWRIAGGKPEDTTENVEVCQEDETGDQVLSRSERELFSTPTMNSEENDTMLVMAVFPKK